MYICTLVKTCYIHNCNKCLNKIVIIIHLSKLVSIQFTNFRPKNYASTFLVTTICWKNTRKRPVFDDAGERDILDRMQSSTRGCKRLKRSKGLSPRREMEVWKCIPVSEWHVCYCRETGVRASGVRAQVNEHREVETRGRWLHAR